MSAKCLSNHHPLMMNHVVYSSGLTDLLDWPPVSVQILQSVDPQNKSSLLSHLSIDSLRPYRSHALLNQAPSHCVKSSHLKIPHTQSPLLFICITPCTNLLCCLYCTRQQILSVPQCRPLVPRDPVSILVSCHVKTRLYKVIGAQPFPLLCLAETVGSWCGWCLWGEGKLNRDVCQCRSENMRRATDGTHNLRPFPIRTVTHPYDTAWGGSCHEWSTHSHGNVFKEVY